MARDLRRRLGLARNREPKPVRRDFLSRSIRTAPEWPFMDQRPRHLKAVPRAKDGSMNYPTKTLDSDVRATSESSGVAEQALKEARESLVLPNLALAASLARRHTGTWHVDEQFIEAALVGLMRAIDSFDPTAPEAFEAHAEMLITREMEQLVEDCRHDREDRILQRDQAAVRARLRVEQALLAQPDFLMLAVSLGFPADNLAAGFLSAVIRNPEILAAAPAAE